jgi:hypothetical protein
MRADRGEASKSLSPLLEFRKGNDVEESKEMHKILVKKKAVPVTGREGPKGCETSRLSHFI